MKNAVESSARRKLTIGVVATKPTQTHSPFFDHLAREPSIALSVAYGFAPSAYHDHGFGATIAWDMHLLGGHDHVVLGPQPATGVTRFRSRLGSTGARPKPPAGTLSLAGAIRRIPQIRSWLRRHCPDVLILQGYQDPLMWVAGALAWSKCALALRGTSLPRSGQRRTASMVLGDVRARAAVRLAQNGLAIGILNEEFYRTHQARRIFKVAYPADTDRFLLVDPRDLESAKSHAKRRLGLDAHRPCIAFVGKLQRWKRPRDLLLAAQHLDQRTSVLIVGSGPLEWELKSLASEMDLDVFFTGFVNRSAMPNYLLAADVLVLPSEIESWGLVVHEGICCGALPVVSDVVGCGPDLVEGIGEIFPVGDVRGLRDAIQRLLSNDGVIQKRRVLALQRAQTYSIENASRELVDACRELRGAQAYD